MKILNRLLRKNVSVAQLAGFVISNFIGLAIIATGLQFYCDIRKLWESDDSFIRQDYLVVNREITGAHTLGGSADDFTEEEIADLSRQPWVRSVGRFSSVDYHVEAAISSGGRGMSTSMFFESIPDEYIDVAHGEWIYTEGSRSVPVIVSKDYLTLYNFGFAASAGLPQLSENMIGSVPLRLRLTSSDGLRAGEFEGRIVGFSNRLNTILVPQAFMEWSNRAYGSGTRTGVRRLIIDVSSPGDVAIEPYLESHGMEMAGDKSNSQASYFLNLAAGVVVAVGVTITVLAFFILMLSVSLLMTKNREKLHSLIMLGYPLRKVGAPYSAMVIWVGALSLMLALMAMWIVRSLYLGGLEALGGGGGVWVSVGVTTVVAAAASLANLVAVNRRVSSAF